MAGIIEPVALALVNNWLSRPQKPGGVRMTGLWLLATSCFLACLGVVWLLIAFNTWMTGLYGPFKASLATGACSFVLAGISTGVFAWRRRQPEPRVEEDSLIETAGALLTALEAMTEGLEEPIAEHPRTSVALATVAGYMAGSRLH